MNKARFFCLFIAAPIFLSLIIFYFFISREVAKVVNIQGKTAGIEIIRDEYGIPHINAKTIEDAMFGVGYAQGQDRLWQIDISRRLASGRLSEILGSKALDIDIFIRNIKIPRISKRDIDSHSIEDQKIYQAFADGINQAAKDSPTPIEYYLTWTEWVDINPYDIQSFLYMNGIGLTSWADDILKHQIANLIGQEAFYIWPTDISLIKPLTYIISSEELDDSLKSNSEEKGMENIPIFNEYQMHQEIKIPEELPDVGSGSNAWVISGKYTKSGKPILSSDPHLSIRCPSIWYLVTFETPDNVFSGAFPVGLPLMPIGRNKDMAWATTASKSDTIDIFIEKIIENQYVYGNELWNLNEFEETIKIRGEGERLYKFKETLHGPILYNSLIGGKKLFSSLPIHTDLNLSFAWSVYNFTDYPIKWLFGVTQAKTIDDVRNALSYASSVNVAMLFASVSGDIYFQSTGKVPLRNGFGDLPLPGWIIENTWKGFIPYEEMPYLINPKKGYIVLANNFMTDSNYKHFSSIGRQFSIGRGERISEIIEQQIKEGIKLTSYHQVVIQQDELSINARENMPDWLELIKDNKDVIEQYTVMKEWNYIMNKESKAASIYALWLKHILKNLLIGKLPDHLFESMMRNVMLRFHLPNYFKPFHPPFPFLCDNSSTIEIETCQDLIKKSFVDACKEASGKKWGEIHQAIPEHMPFSKVPVLNRIFNMNQGVGGLHDTIHCMLHSWIDGDIKSNHGPGLKFIVDLGNTTDNYWSLDTGQSGNPFSKNFNDMFKIMHTENLIQWSYHYNIK